MPPRGRHSSRRGRTAHGSDVPGAAWPRHPVGLGVVALCPWAFAPGGGWTESPRSCPRAYLRNQHDHRRGLSLPLRSSAQRSFPQLALRSSVLWPPRTPRCAAADFAFGLYGAPCPDEGRADGSPVFRTSPCSRAAPYPAGSSRALRTLRGHCCLRRDMSGSASGLSIFRGCRLHFMLRPASSLGPWTLLTPRSAVGISPARLGSATRRSDAYRDGTCTRWRSAA